MRRRDFIVVGCFSIVGISAGCLDDSNSEPVGEIDSLELRNDRRDEAHEFMVQIEDEAGTVFEETYQLEKAGSGQSAVTLDEPVEPGTYTVLVEAGEQSATVDIQDVLTDDQTCIRLQFYLSPETLHSEPQLYDQCSGS